MALPDRDTNILFTDRWIRKPGYDLSALKRLYDGSKTKRDTDVTLIEKVARAAGIIEGNTNGCLFHWKINWLDNRTIWLDALSGEDARTTTEPCIRESVCLGIFFGFYHGWISDIDLHRND